MDLRSFLLFERSQGYQPYAVIARIPPMNRSQAVPISGSIAKNGQRSEIMITLKGLEGDEHYERLVLYLALACQPNAMPEEIANAQVIILSYVNELGSFDNLVRSSISNWIVKSWHDELDDRSFRLNTPGLLRRESADIPSSSNYPSDAARVLLAAEHAAGTTYDKSVREQLAQIANLTQSV